MKHLFNFIIALILIWGNNSIITAQQQIPSIPQDPNVRIGKLKNGLTYYIRHNNLPEKRAEFYIAQKVGSILENEKQRGLAHFLEHMCFNGTKNFPNKTLITYLESIGVKFGENLNAYTSIDETVYNISNVPVTRDGIIDSCLLIMHDWANALTLSNKEIDNERGVIHEEWRTRMSPMLRMYEKVLPELYPNSKYGHRLPIGLMEVVDNFPYQVLKDYYHKWYRPDQQGIIVVGDIDVDKVEKKIKSIFSPIKMPKNAAKREYVKVPDLNRPIITIASDKEQTSTSMMISYKYDGTPDSLKNRVDYLVANFMKSMIESMLNDRYSEIVEKANPPFTYAQVSDEIYIIAKTKNAFTGNVGSKENHIPEALKAFFTEIERIRRYGFTEGEFARAKANYLKMLESAYNERSKTKSKSYVNEYVQNFINGEPIPGIENEYMIMSKIVPSIPVKALNSFIEEITSDKNIVVSIFGPEKDGIKYPSKKDIISLMENVKKSNITEYVDSFSNKPLISKLPEAGKITKTQQGAFGTTILTLSNGVRVIVKPTDYKADQIIMSAFSPGGTSIFPDKDIVNIKLLNDVSSLGGLGNFSNIDLGKVLAGKKVSVSSSVSSNTENVSGSCSPKDFETLMQLTYLSFMSPRKDMNAFNSYIERLKNGLKNQESKPSTALSDTLQKALYMNHPRTIRLKAEMIDKVDYDKIISMYNDRFKDAGDFTFIFVGNIDIEKTKPLFEKYLGALPTIHRKESFRDTKQYMRKGMYKNIFAKKQETPKSTVLMIYSGDEKYNLKNSLMMSMYCQLLDMIFTEEVREKESGTYGVSCRGSISKYPKERAILQINFDTNSEQREKLTKIVKAQITNFIKNGPSETNLKKVKEFMLKSHKENIKENGYWINVINEYYWKGINANKDYEMLVNSISGKDIQKFAESLLKQKNLIEVSMTDEQSK